MADRNFSKQLSLPLCFTAILISYSKCFPLDVPTRRQYYDYSFSKLNKSSLEDHIGTVL